MARWLAKVVAVVSDMAALVSLQRSKRRWRVLFFGLLPVNSLVQGLIQHGPLRWFHFGATAALVMVLAFIVRQRRQIARDYERQKPLTVDVQRDEDTR